MKFCIPPDKLERLLESIKFLLVGRKVLVKTLASWVSLLQSFRLAIGPLVSIMFLSFYDAIKNAPSWSSCISLSVLVKTHLKWWLLELQNLTEYDICPSPSITKFDFSIVSDARNRGYFVYELAVKSRVISRHFTPAEAAKSSTSVGHYTDNVASVYILSSGFRQPKLQALALDVFMQ